MHRITHGRQGDFYHRYRPCRFDEVIGHKMALASIERLVKKGNASRVVLFHGDSGTGKTTVARILAMAVNCTGATKTLDPCCECLSCKAIMDGTSIDVHEINAADTRGIDDIRRIKDDMMLTSMLSSNKVYILDECHALTKDAQNSLIKILEEAPPGVFIILCSTDPRKLLPTVLNRCQKFQFKALSDADVLTLLTEVCEAEEITSANPQVLLAIVGKSGGSPRNALVYLQQLAQAGALSSSLEDVADIITVIQDFEPAAIEICRALFSGKGWSDISPLFSACQVPPESLRIALLGYGRALLLGAKSKDRADFYARAMETLLVPLHDVKPENGLVVALYKITSFSNPRSRS